MLHKLERRLGRYAIPHLMTILVGGQAVAFVLTLVRPELATLFFLVPERVLAGEVWRVVSFLFMPPSSSPIFMVFALYLLFLYGRALEEHWGSFRFNVFLFVGWIASVASAFIVPTEAATNIFLMGSIVLAFAYLYPNFELLLMFILPVKVKWIALLTLAGLLYLAYQGGWDAKAQFAAGTLNFVLFFGHDIYRRLRGAGRRTVVREREKRTAGKANHQCAVCGITDVEDPNMQFRYCSQCDGKKGYCIDHIRDHEHTKTVH